MTRTLIVTGASKGLGAHVSRRAIEEGYRVVGLARNFDDTHKFSDHFEPVVCDVTDPERLREVAKSKRRDDEIYGVINCAGVASMNLAVSTPASTIDKLINTNLLGTIHSSIQFGKLLARKKRGRIINFSTIAVALSLKGESIYVASKAGVEGFSRTFAREMADFNVTVNCIAPGPIDTQLIAGVPKASINKIVEQQIIPRKAKPEDVWKVISMLLDDRSDMITGEILNLGGA
ncbi:SDR family oxidoreductase [Marinicauda algicola]|uniref:SDR family oxidoreductase n=1 Tax=Marinicauda algicola TaxID=2029849 RepID=A0A4S2H3X8_9PROT|nr:SDR family oxidoreductase [Marinicauda algicola]TGY90296.1 SDR family oxidoreductase [Marinicauda algicola]